MKNWSHPGLVILKSSILIYSKNILEYSLFFSHLHISHFKIILMQISNLFTFGLKVTLIFFAKLSFIPQNLFHPWPLPITSSFDWVGSSQRYSTCSSSRIQRQWNPALFRTLYQRDDQYWVLAFLQAGQTKFRDLITAQIQLLGVFDMVNPGERAMLQEWDTNYLFSERLALYTGDMDQDDLCSDQE